MTKVHSFDIFDTCLIRKCGDARNVFDILAYEILGDDSPESVRMDFANIRIEAEANARNNQKQEDITLTDIYEFCDFTGITKISCDLIKKTEIEIEENQLIPVLTIREKINYLRSMGNQIIYISDMYLSHEFILNQLIKCGFYNSNDKLYVSSEVGLTKHTSNLFFHVAKENNIEFKNWVHYGDNIHSDILIPRKLGIKSVLINHLFSEIENKWIKKSYSSGYFESQILAGISKGIRLTKKENVQIDFTVNLIAPLYTCFVYRILKTAQKDGIKKLFFLARDGYILYLIAKEFQGLFPDIRLEYIYVSRKSLYLPSITEYHVDEIIELLNPVLGKSVKEILDRLSIDFSPYCDENFLSIHIDYDNIGLIYDFFEKPTIRDFILNESFKSRNLITEYFQQVGLCDNNHIHGIVDLRGTRSSHAAINKILTANGYNSVTGFYFEVVENRKSIQKAGNYYSDFFKERKTRNNNLGGIFNHYNLLEQFFSITDQKRTIGYQKNATIIEPIFERETQLYSTENKKINTAKIHNDIIVEFARSFLQTKLYLHSDKLYYSLAIPTVAEFGIRPNQRLLSALIHLRTSDNEFSKEIYVKKYDLKDWINVFLFSRKIQKNSYWFKGSIYLNMGNGIGDIYLFIFKVVRKIKKIILGKT
jgi:predicted HAD superfamily hydrolase